MTLVAYYILLLLQAPIAIEAEITLI